MIIYQLIPGAMEKVYCLIITHTGKNNPWKKNSEWKIVSKWSLDSSYCALAVAFLEAEMHALTINGLSIDERIRKQKFL